MKSVAITLTIITCRTDMMIVAGVVPIGHYRQLSLGFSCRHTLTNASHHILIFSRFQHLISETFYEVVK